MNNGSLLYKLTSGGQVVVLIYNINSLCSRKKHWNLQALKSDGEGSCGCCRKLPVQLDTICGMGVSLGPSAQQGGKLKT